MTAIHSSLVNKLKQIPSLLLKPEERFEIMSEDIKKYLANSFGLNASDKFILALCELYKSMVDISFDSIRRGTRNIPKTTKTFFGGNDNNRSNGFRCLAKIIVQHNIELGDDTQAKINISNLFNERLRDKNSDFINSLLLYSRKIKMK